MLYSYPGDIVVIPSRIIASNNAFSDEKQFEELNYSITGFAWFITPFLSIFLKLVALSLPLLLPGKLFKGS